MPAQNDLVPGIEFGSCINSAAELEQLVSGATPQTYIAFLYTSNAAPDVASNARYARYLWLDTNSAPPAIKYYDGASWVLWRFPDNSLPGSVLADGSVSLVKLSPGSGNANRVVRVNGAGTEIIFDDPLNLYGSNVFPIIKLVKGSDGTLLVTEGGAISWTAAVAWLQGKLAAVADSTIPVAKLAPGAEHAILKSVGSSPVPQWVIDKIIGLAPGAPENGKVLSWDNSAGQYVFVNNSPNFGGRVAAQSAGTGTALGSSATMIAELALTLPAGKRWSWIRVGFSTAMDPGASYRGVENLTLKHNGTTLSFFTNATASSYEANLTYSLFPIAFVWEGVPSGFENVNLDLEIWANYPAAASAGDEIGYRKIYAVGEYVDA